MRRRYNTNEVITVSVSDLFGDLENPEIIDESDALYLRDELEEARRCLNRPERSPAEAVEHIERALTLIERVLR